MKIIQNIPITDQSTGSMSAAPQEDYAIYHFLKSNFSQITHAYLRGNINMDTGAKTGHIEIYDKTNAVVLAEITSNTITPTWEVSSDFEASLPDEADLIIRSWQDGNEEDDTVYGYNLILYIEQECTTNPRKTEAVAALSKYLGGGTGTTFISTSSCHLDPEIENMDGTKIIKLESVMLTGAGGRAECRLYDFTANEAVTDSLITTTSLTRVRVTSGALTLQEGHKYGVQFRNNQAATYTSFNGTKLIITQSNFNKCIAIVHLCTQDTRNAGLGYQEGAYPIELKESALSAEVNITYVLKSSFFGKADIGTPHNWRYYNDTKTSAVDNTTHEITSTAYSYYYFDDIITPSGDDDLYVFQSDHYNISLIDQDQIWAILEDTPFPQIYILPDPSQPSGYHCFMKQFIKNCLAGFVPELTPDCINFCW